MNTNRSIARQTVIKDADLHHRAHRDGKVPGRGECEGIPIEITHERIRIRAYEIFVARNGGPGDATTDWCQAERELHEKAGVGPACDGSIADPAVLRTRPRCEAGRPRAPLDRGGL